MTVHLVNLTNPMMKGPIREIIPVPAQQLRLLVPAGKRVGKVALLVANREIAYRRDGLAIVVEIPSVGLHEVVALDFEA